MYLMKFKVFNEIIDEMVQRHGCLVAKDEHEFLQTDFINANKFKHYIKQNSMQTPISLFFRQIANESSPFIKLLCMNNVFVVRNEKDLLLSARVEHLEAVEASI